jgi:hypothetical protein
LRLQLRRVGALAAAAVVLVTTLLVTASARAQVVVVETAHTFYHEAPTRTNMTVYTPGVDIAATPVPWFTVTGGYEADIVSGASVSVKAGSAYQAVNPGADVISTASVHDIRQSPRGGITLRKADVEYTAQYTYGTEHDYKSHSIFVGAKTEAYEHNTQFEISYARNFDLVCDRVQAVNDQPARFHRLEDSTACFTQGTDAAAQRTRHTLSIDGLQAGWTQAWTPEFATQLAYTAQIVDGFQSSPYRAVILGQGVEAQEHHPENRARQSVSLRANLYIRPLKLAVRIGGRVYRDTWDITSGTGELEAERYITEGLRVAARGRYYKQSGASFWSDDYTGGNPPLGPKGRYWTGDRELSPFWSIAVGLRLTYGLTPTKGRILGLMSGLKLGVSADVVQFDYEEYTLGGTPITNARAYILGANLSALF